ncbi:Protein CBG10343 [Caenorhabditis briggsae]|uniref:Protein CBG10343 n=2 Tax=Caenorhabditis briggsae TaxID=6238 RepID=A8XAJ6_CAEBR|nr:Protein CBG10343 [Caenorhabditis briggsae]ULU08322.1 hypothetical protein L3Y34_019466 [Caenorhabditis briggsae]CAP29661.1 Protein CBG10343 [Caenorhabditis briggsae]
MTLTAEEIANQKRVLKNQREKQHYQNINKELEKLGKQLPNPAGGKLSKIETLKLANKYLESLKKMLNEKEDIKPMATGPRKIKVEPEWIAQPVVAKQEKVKSIKMEILEYREQAERVEYGNVAFYDETSDPERFFRELDESLGFVPAHW